MKSIFNNSIQINPGNYDELVSWSRKWRISINELNRAIVDTGSTNVRSLKEHIKKRKNCRG